MKRTAALASIAAAAALTLSSCTGNLMELIHDSLDPILWSQRLEAPSSTNSKIFGSTTAVSGDTIAIGDPRYGSDLSSPNGRAFVYQIVSGEVQQKKELDRADDETTGVPDGFFSQALSVSGDYAIAGYYADLGGLPFPKWAIYNRNHPTLDAWEKVGDAIAAVYDLDFADAVVIGDGFTAAGEPAGPVAGARGRVHLYTYTGGEFETWAPTTVPYYEWGTLNDRFGAVLSASGSMLLAGAPGVSGGTTVAGSAVLLRYSAASDTGISSSVTLTNPDGQPGDEFGCSVGLSGDYALVGARSDDFHGSASLYFKDQSGADTWGMQARIEDPADAAGDQFGFSAAINGDNAVVGAPQTVVGGVDSGCAYLYKRTGTAWSMVKQLTADEGLSGMRFGASVSLSEEYIVIGAPGAQGGGAAFVYALK